MFSITPDLENSEYNGWLNPEILIKNNRRQGGNRKRGYELANIDLGEECEDVRGRVLRPRHDPELNNSQEASRTRPIPNRIRQRLLERTNNTIRTEPPNQPQVSATVPDINISQSANDLALLQAIAAFNWSQSNLFRNADTSFLPSIQHATYPNLTNVHMSQRIPQFDPWVLHNYLLAASYSAASTSHVSADATSNDEATALRMSQMAYPSMTPEMNRTNSSLLWSYPYFLNLPTSVNTVPNQSSINRSSHDIHTHSTGSTQMEQQTDFSSYLRYIDYSQRDSLTVSNDTRIFPAMYQNDPRISNFCAPILSNPFSYGSICPYHSSGHLIHNSNQSQTHMAGSDSLQSEPASSQAQNAFTNFPHSSGITFDQFWPDLTHTIRPLNYSLNGSNIDTLLHLAAHFEQRKRGITREELDKLPTHRYKAPSDKHKLKEKNSISDAKNPKNSKEDIHKCLVCLEDFESKQNIRVLRCEHEFHAKCIDKWLKINRTCPLCRADAFDGSAQKDGA